MCIVGIQARSVRDAFTPQPAPGMPRVSRLAGAQGRQWRLTGFRASTPDPHALGVLRLARSPACGVGATAALPTEPLLAVDARPHISARLSGAVNRPTHRCSQLAALDEQCASSNVSYAPRCRRHAALPHALYEPGPGVPEAAAVAGRLGKRCAEPNPYCGLLRSSEETCGGEREGVNKHLRLGVRGAEWCVCLPPASRT